METQRINSQLVPVLFSETHAELLLKRLDQLFPYTPTQAGTKNATQMLSDCAEKLELAFGKTIPPRPFSQLSMGRFFKSEQSLHSNIPKDFHQEKLRLMRLIRHFVMDAPARSTSHQMECEALAYQYLDTHLTHFGV
ncbi:hypothetical protein [Xanthocytophaga agilis]|uniref:Uncharacterized protein n=1 Tax=Xanthocytophaga agilis TaxID=3048010 RepID=A0AAE3R482_9BACT|nr:hypothetical protein [Xanthocytophaga agilis]MDJ1501115.1 hypothetical protein [Xanthocytophaga agilis]